MRPLKIPNHPFPKVKNISSLIANLEEFGLGSDETAIFLSLMEKPKTPLAVSRETKIARSNVYRLVDALKEKSLVCEITTEDGKQLSAARPETLELLVLQQEERAETQRKNLHQLIPLLQALTTQGNSVEVKTYQGVAGIKQMLWNELKTQGEILIFSCDSINTATGKSWAEKFRAEIIRRKIKQRSIENLSTEIEEPLSIHKEYAKYYEVRRLSERTLEIKQELTIHDDTISIYNAWTQETQIGSEIKHPFLAAFMRQIFEHYWNLAKIK